MRWPQGWDEFYEQQRRKNSDSGTGKELVVTVTGTAPVILHRWSTKMGWLVAGRRLEPEEDAAAHCYWLPDGTPGMPAVAFKAAMVVARDLFPGEVVAGLRDAIYVRGEGPERLVRLLGSKVLWQYEVGDMKRHYYMLRDWQASLHLCYDSAVLSRATVLALVDAAGLCGVGLWRPSSPKAYEGPYGTWALRETGDARFREEGAPSPCPLP